MPLGLKIDPQPGFAHEPERHAYFVPKTYLSHFDIALIL